MSELLFALFKARLGRSRFLAMKIQNSPLNLKLRQTLIRISDFSNLNSSMASVLIPLSANRLTVAVSDVLNPNVDDMSRGMGYDGVNAVFSPQVLCCRLD